MGYGSWNSINWSTYTTTVSSKSVDEIYTSKSLSDDLNPINVSVRESRDSEDHPESTAIIVGLDVTGSMGMLAHTMATKGLGTLIQEILDRKPVTDPHNMIAAIGDVEFDKSPLQVTQFESSNILVNQLERLHIESGGGGNTYESYIALWYFAATKTAIDCFEKRGKKGYLFTVGDECITPFLTKNSILKFIGGQPTKDEYTPMELFNMVNRMYNVYHIIVEEGSHVRTWGIDHVKKSWLPVLGQRVICLSDHSKLSEVIVSAIQLNEGIDKQEIINSWDGSTSVVVANAVNNLPSEMVTNNKVIRF